MQAISAEEMRSQMLSVDQAREKLEYTDGLTEREFDTHGKVNKLNFTFADDWNAGIEDKDDFDEVDAQLVIDGTELPMTKYGALALSAEVGLPKASAADAPGPLVQNWVNYWYSNGARGKAKLKLLSSDAGVLTVTRGTVTPFSNIALLNSAVEGITERAKVSEADLMIDYKFQHSLDNTTIRIVLPSTRSIQSKRAEKKGEDLWSLGIELKNSITGKSALEAMGYLFAWWCTNGCTIQHASSGKFRRKPSLTPENAYEWAQKAVGDVFADLTPALDDVEHLTTIPLEDEMNTTLERMFERFEVPSGLRKPIIHNLAESDDLTAYGLMQAITSSANDPELSANSVDTLLASGGELAHVLAGRCESCHRF